MMARSTVWLVFGLMGMTLGAVHGEHRYNCDPIVRLAADIEHHAHDLEHEFRHAYRTTPFYGQLLSQVRLIDSQSMQLGVAARAGRDYECLHHMVDDLEHSYIRLANTVRLADASCRSTHGVTYWRHDLPIRNEIVRESLACLHRSIHSAHDRLTGIFGNPRPEPLPRPGHPHGRTADRVPGGHGHGPATSGRNPGFTFGSATSPADNGFSFSAGRVSFNFGR